MITQSGGAGGVSFPQHFSNNEKSQLEVAEKWQSESNIEEGMCRHHRRRRRPLGAAKRAQVGGSISGVVEHNGFNCRHVTHAGAPAAAGPTTQQHCLRGYHSDTPSFLRYS